MSAPAKLDAVANMYDARKKLKFGLKGDYEKRIAPIRDELKKIMKSHSCNEIQAALLMVNAIDDKNDPHRKKVLSGYIFSAALDIDDEQAQRAIQSTNEN